MTTQPSATILGHYLIARNSLLYNNYTVYTKIIDFRDHFSYYITQL